MKAKIKVIATVLAAAMLFAGSALAAEKWMKGDFHQHTTYTDGSYPMNDLTAANVIATSAWADPTGLYRKGVMPQGFRFGLDFQANSEHGGTSGKDNFNNAWTTYTPNPAVGDAGKMWRWQTLIRTSDIPGYTGPAYMGAFDWINTIRANYPTKLAMTGMEWNPPGHEHSSTGIVAADARPIAEFEYRFDSSDSDGTLTTSTADKMGWTGKLQNSVYTASAPDYSASLGLNKLHNKTVDGVKWMQANYPTTGYIVPAHVERAGCGLTGGAWNIAAFRDINDNGPTVAFGFEGIPGHEKDSGRGGFGSGACGGGTYGGAGYYIAAVGGLWDNLLADGRKFFNFASSDFHNEVGSDFWPGEYLKSHVKVKDADNDGVYTQEDVVNGLRAGNAYSVHGDIINELDYKVLFKTPFGTKSATMGETLEVKKGNKLTVQIRFKTPATNNCQAGVNASANYICQAPSVHHVQLIQGKVNPTKESKFLADGTTPNPAYIAIDPTAASVVATYDTTGGLIPTTAITATKWSADAQGYTTMTFTVPNVQNSMFFRIRGSNLGYGVSKISGANVVYGNDAAGNPLINTPGTNNADMAWDDLWFYSNPIFVKAL
jgi:hypothetical protein